MKVKCSNCKHAFLVPAEFTDKAVKCPECKGSVDVTETRSNTRFLLIVIISAALVGAIGFGLGAALNQTSKQEIEEANKKIARLRDDVEQFRTQNQQLEVEVREAWATKQKVERELDKIRELIRKQTMVVESESDITEKSRRKVNWEELGFPNFYKIPDNGKVDYLAYVAPGSYGRVIDAEILQILASNEMLINHNVFDSEPISPGAATHTGRFIKRIIRVKGYPTKGLIDGVRWPRDVMYGDRGTAEIAIIGTWTYLTAKGSQKTVPTAIPLDFVRKGLTEAEFEQLLK